MPDSSAEWTALRIVVAATAADAVANFLLEEGAPGVVTDVREGAALGRPAVHARLEAHVPAGDATRVASALGRYLESLADVWPDWETPAIEMAGVPAVDWDGVYRAHHHPQRIGRRLLVAPPWDVPNDPDRIALVVEPGMAFGTGQHATTRTCLEEIEAATDAGTVASAVDVGTGSGILAAALARLGVPRVVAFDSDVAVLPLARETLRRNGAAAVHLFAGTAAALRGRFDVVVANLLADILVAEAATLAGAVARGGRLVVSGLLDTQAERVAAAFPDWTVTATRADEAWRTLRLERRA